MITFKKLMDMYDEWNGITKINDNMLSTVCEGKTVNLIDEHKELWDKEVVSFGFYDNTFCVRLDIITKEE